MGLRRTAIPSGSVFSAGVDRWCHSCPAQPPATALRPPRARENMLDALEGDCPEAFHIHHGIEGVSRSYYIKPIG